MRLWMALGFGLLACGEPNVFPGDGAPLTEEPQAGATGDAGATDTGTGGTTIDGIPKPTAGAPETGESGAGGSAGRGGAMSAHAGAGGLPHGGTSSGAPSRAGSGGTAGAGGHAGSSGGAPGGMGGAAGCTIECPNGVCQTTCGGSGGEGTRSLDGCGYRNSVGKLCGEDEGSGVFTWTCYASKAKPVGNYPVAGCKDDGTTPTADVAELTCEPATDPQNGIWCCNLPAVIVEGDRTACDATELLVQNYTDQPGAYTCLDPCAQ